MILYFSHPTFTFNTKTERKCLKILDKVFEPDETINPSDHGLKYDPRDDIKRADRIVGMAVSNTFSFIVWKEMDIAEENNTELYTLMVENRNDIGPMVEGIPDDIKRLSREKSKELSRQITLGNRESIFSLIVGNWNKRF